MNDWDVTLGLFVGTDWAGARSRDTRPVLNPATGKELGRLPVAEPEDLDLALETSERGFQIWRRTAAEERGNVLRRAAAEIRGRADRLARIATFEQGKVLAEAKGEVLAAAAVLDFHAGEAQRIYGRVLPRPAGSRSMVLPQPIGPVAAFCAWNFPVLNVVRKLSPAIAAGCSVILKPSEETAGSAIEVVKCFHAAGLPPEVIQLVFGVPDTVARYILASPTIRKVSFTGSVPVGKHLMRLAADTVKRMTMELGGHSPVLVFDDCDLDRTLDTLVSNKFRNAGQVCISPTRFHVQASIHDRFAAGFAERAKALKVGDGFAGDVQMGPMANARRPDAIAAMVQDARDSGARVLTGGQSLAKPGGGFFYAPTVLSDVPLTAPIMSEEPFGPVAMIRPFETIEEAIAEANRLPYGLAAYCFTENGRRQNILAEELESGMVGINTVRLSWPDSPFGGMKESGFGSEDGPEGVAAHLATKAVHIA